MQLGNAAVLHAVLVTHYGKETLSDTFRRESENSELMVIFLMQEKFYGKNWSLRVRLCDDYNLIVAPIAASGNALMKSRDSYMLVPSLRELYEEPALQDGFYVFRPRRVVS